MHKFLSCPALACLSGALLALPAVAQEPAKTLTPGDIVAAAPAVDWARIAPADLVVMDLAPDAAGKARRVVIQLMPAPFSQGWVANIRKLVAARWYDGIAIVRVQDNYVVQWGDPDGEDSKKAKPLPSDLENLAKEAYTIDGEAATAPITTSFLSLGADASQAETFKIEQHLVTPLFPDAYGIAGYWDGWPVGESLVGKGRKQSQTLWPIHCYGMVGVGRNLSPDTGSGAELYAVIGQAPRQLDRNIALVGRVIAGIENLSALPRGTGPLGFYETPAERVPIVSVRMGDEVTDLPAYEYLSTESASFAAYADKRANRQDDFYIRPAGGVDICNVPVPIRTVGGAVKRVGM